MAEDTGGGSASQPHLEARMEYGFAASRGILTPYWSYVMTGVGERRHRLGVSWDVVDERLQVGLEGERLESSGPAEHRISLNARIHF